MILRLSLWKDYRERNLISFSFLHVIEVYVMAIATCVICFSGKISRVHTSVELICSVCVKRKHFVSVKSSLLSGVLFSEERESIAIRE